MIGKRKLKNYLIDRKMQINIALKHLVLALLSSFFTGLIVYLSIWPTVINYVPRTLVDRIYDQIIMRMVVMGVPFVIVMLCVSIVISHRIAGPVYKIIKTIDRVNNGEHVNPVYLRKGDFLNSLAQRINTLINRIQ